MTGTCKGCGKDIEVKPNGLHFKWFDRSGDWHCGNDPRFPVRAHEPTETA